MELLRKAALKKNRGEMCAKTITRTDRLGLRAPGSGLRAPERSVA
jgi:hypothetical protein